MAVKRGLTAKQVQALIKQVGSGRELARRAGVSPGSISKWKKRGVSDEYATILRAGTRRPATKQRYAPPKKRKRASGIPKSPHRPPPRTQRERELEARLIEAEEARDALRGQSLDFEQRVAELEEELDSPEMTFEMIIQLYQDLDMAPTLDEAMGLADDFDISVHEVYDAYYEED